LFYGGSNLIGQFAHINDSESLDRIIRNLQAYLVECEVQAAKFGAYAPPHILTEITDTKAKLSEAKARLDELQSTITKRANGNNSKLFSLIEKVQGNQTSLTQCFVEALSISQDFNDFELLEFCQFELAGYMNRNPIYGPKYRLIGAKATSISMAGGSSTNFTEPIKISFFIDLPISEIEQKVFTERSVIVDYTPAYKIFPNYDQPNSYIIWNTLKSSFTRILDEIRRVLTAFLLRLVNVAA